MNIVHIEDKCYLVVTAENGCGGLDHLCVQLEEASDNIIRAYYESGVEI